MKRYFSQSMGLLLICALTAGCGAADGQTEDTAAASQNTTADAAALVADIPTTQYFTDDPVADEDIEKILQAGVNAPSAMNGQPWHFTAITDESVLQEIADGMSSFGGAPDAPDGDSASAENAPAAPTSSKAGITDAPLVIVVSCEEGSELDAGLACQNMSVEAQLLGYGSKIISSPTIALNGDRQDEFRELLGIPEDQTAAALLLVGTEDTSVDTSADTYTGATERNPLDDMVTFIEP